jgi:hypothetical protein
MAGAHGVAGSSCCRCSPTQLQDLKSQSSTVDQCLLHTYACSLTCIRRPVWHLSYSQLWTSDSTIPCLSGPLWVGSSLQHLLNMAHSCYKLYCVCAVLFVLCCVKRIAVSCAVLRYAVLCCV